MQLYKLREILSSANKINLSSMENNVLTVNKIFCSTILADFALVAQQQLNLTQKLINAKKLSTPAT